MKKIIYLGLLLFVTSVAKSQTVIPPGDYLGADLIMTAGQSLTGGHYANIGRFVIPSGTTIPIVRNTGVVRISANEITIAGNLNGNFAGYPGGAQVACGAGTSGLTGSGPGGGTGGEYGETVHGNGGAGGGYGGNGGNSGQAQPTPLPGAGGLTYGDITNGFIEMGSGGGSGANYAGCQSLGGRGGAGGGAIHLESPNVNITGQITARGENGAAGTRLTATNIFASGGAGSGGGVLITGAGSIGGLIDVSGGNGGNSPNVGFSIGGAGGGGGRIKIYGSFTTSGIRRSNGGVAGTSFAGALVQSQPGQPGTITIANDAPTITAATLEFSEFCAGAEGVSITFGTSGAFDASNIFTAQLSDGTGSFASPIAIGTSSTAGSISATLPSELATGTGYRIRVVSSSPAVVGANNGSNLTINSLPAAVLSGDALTCPGSSANITIELTGEGPWSGVYSDGTNNFPFTAVSASWNISVSPTVTTKYTLVSVSDVNCNGLVSGTATITVEDATAPIPDVAELPVLTAECNLTATPPTATDNCKGPVTGSTEDPISFDTQGTFTINWSYSDDHGNTSTQQQTVVIDDVTAPVLAEALPEVTAQCTITLSSPPTALDNCAGTVTAATEDPLTYSEEGSYTIHWKFDDGNGNILESTQVVVVDDTEAPVLDAPLADLTAQCGLVISGAPTATDNCVGTITATTASPLSYDAEGTYHITWKFDDGNGNNWEAIQTVTIDDTEAPVPLTSVLPDVTAACSVTITAVPVAADNCAGELHATTTDPLSYSTAGTHVITWTFDDGNGNTTQQTQNIIIEDNVAPVIPDVNFEISSESTAGVCGRVVVFDDPTPTDNCSVVRFERTDESGLESGDVFPAGTTIITYEAEDAAGHVTEASFSITITNDLPAINSVTGPTAAMPVNSVITIIAQFTDANAQIASINWGDGAITAATLLQTTLTGQHRYTDAGTYSVEITLTDACGEVAEATYTVAIFDQNGGHVTGAGLFNSPRDAYRNDRNASCVAAFELNIKYRNGSSVPEGKTEFRLLGSNLRFKSTSYEWLTIAGHHALYKGKGELNGQKGYHFLVSAIDGGRLVDNSHQLNLTIDKLRIKIWNNAGVVIYDNQSGADDNAEPTTSVLGVIVIHKGKKRNANQDLRTVEPAAEVIIAETKLSVYPNPFVDVITVQLDPQIKVNPTIQLFDNSGRALYAQEHTYQGSGTYSVNVGDAAAKSGVYLLRISQGQRSEVVKVFGGAR